MSAEKLPINIWGKPGCELPNGGLCNACCILFKINEPEWGETGFYKEENVPCTFLARMDGKGMGCGIHGLHPCVCQAYHCGKRPPMEKLFLIDTTQQAGLVSREEADTAVSKLQEHD